MCSARASNFSQGTGSTLYLQKKQWGEENEGELMGGVLAAAVVVSNDTRKRTRWVLETCQITRQAISFKPTAAPHVQW